MYLRNMKYLKNIMMFSLLNTINTIIFWTMEIYFNWKNISYFPTFFLSAYFQLLLAAQDIHS